MPPEAWTFFAGLVAGAVGGPSMVLLWPRKSPPPKVTRAQAMDAYLSFMEGRSGSSFTWPVGDFSADQIARDVVGIVLYETAAIGEAPWSKRLAAFQSQRGGKPWPRLGQ
jgi:hypothetical protein